jgi:tetratricopeptide (TPR) repeat protein
MREHPFTHNYLGMALKKKGLRDEAVAEYREAIRLDPSFEYRILAYYNAAVEKEPVSAELHGRRGRFFAQQKEWNRALEDLTRAIELEPAGGLFQSRGRVFIALGEYQKALADLHEAIRLNPQSSACYADRGNVYGYLHHWREAAGDLCQGRRAWRRRFFGLPSPGGGMSSRGRR